MLLKPAYSPSRLPSPRSWNELACGEYIRAQTQMLLDDYGRRLRIGTTVGLGNLAEQLQYQAFSLNKPFIVAPHIQRAGVRAQLEHLPIKNAVADQVILPFVLEFCRDPHQILREVNRILADDGYIFLTGFNPFSPALLSGWLPGRRKGFPWSGRYFSALRIKDWLSLLGYEIVQQDYYIGRFLVSDAEVAEHSQKNVWTETLCRKLPLLNSGYAILARKCVYLRRPRLQLRETASLTRQPVAAARVKALDIHSTLNRDNEVLHD